MSKENALLYTGETVAEGGLILPEHWNGEYTEIEIPKEPESMPDECGIAGVCLTESTPQLGAILKAGIRNIQHRGQEAAGIALLGKNKVYELKGFGLVNDALEKSKVNKMKSGQIGVSQCRYSTVELETEEELYRAAQPISRRMLNGKMLSVAHNGHMPMIHKVAEKYGVDISECTTDTDVLSCIIAQVRPGFKTIEDTVEDVLAQIEGAYSLIIAAEDKLIGVRDPYGFRPLMLGSYEGSVRGFAFNSESHPFKKMGAEFRREVARGEMLIADKKGRLEERHPFERRPDKLCAMELVYLYGPHGLLKDRSVQMVREQMGRVLAREHPTPPDVDFIVGIPDSGVPAGEGFAREIGKPYEHAFVRERYIGERLFINPDEDAREAGTTEKLNVIMPKVLGKILGVVDDSIVRGTTTRAVVEQLFKKGALGVHLRSSSPLILNPCFMGLNTGNPRELVANVYKGKIKRINRYIGSTSLGYLSIPGLYTATNAAGKMCMACFDGDYPIEVPYDVEDIRRPNGIVYDSAMHEIE